MDEATYKKRVERLKEVDKVVKALDPTIREASFKLLQSYITEEKPNNGSGVDGGTSGEDIFTKFDHDKPADNILLIAAHHFSQYGNAIFSLNDIREISADVGLTIPGRLDMTLNTASRKGKKLFASAGRGKYKPTVHGEKYFKETYDVSKGTKQKPGEDDR